MQEFSGFGWLNLGIETLMFAFVDFGKNPEPTWKSSGRKSVLYPVLLWPSAMSEEPCALYRQFQAVDTAYRAGDMDALCLALGDPPDFPNGHHPLALAVGDHPLEYAIYWSPVAFIAELIAQGADVNYRDAAGFPTLHAAISSGRREQHAILETLLQAGADPNQRGLNDWTPLHHAVARRDLQAIEQLLAHGADVALATRIDDCTTALEDAAAMEFDDASRLLDRAIAARRGGAS